MQTTKRATFFFSRKAEHHEPQQGRQAGSSRKRPSERETCQDGETEPIRRVSLFVPRVTFEVRHMCAIVEQTS